MAVIFIYDSLLRPESLEKIKVFPISYEPGFAGLRLHIWRTNILTNKNGTKRTAKNFLTFGTIYHIADEDMDKLKLHYGDVFYSLESLTTYPIRFQSMRDFLSQKWQVLEKKQALAFLGNMENEDVKRVVSSYRYRAGNFCKEFIQTYQNGFNSILEKRF